MTIYFVIFIITYRGGIYLAGEIVHQLIPRKPALHANQPPAKDYPGYISAFKFHNQNTPVLWFGYKLCSCITPRLIIWQSLVARTMMPSGQAMEFIANSYRYTGWWAGRSWTVTLHSSRLLTKWNKTLQRVYLHIKEYLFYNHIRLLH